MIVHCKFFLFSLEIQIINNCYKLVIHKFIHIFLNSGLSFLSMIDQFEPYPKLAFSSEMICVAIVTWHVLRGEKEITLQLPFVKWLTIFPLKFGNENQNVAHLWNQNMSKIWTHLESIKSHIVGFIHRC